MQIVILMNHYFGIIQPTKNSIHDSTYMSYNSLRATFLNFF